MDSQAYLFPTCKDDGEEMEFLTREPYAVKGYPPMVSDTFVCPACGRQKRRIFDVGKEPRLKRYNRNNPKGFMANQVWEE